MSEDILAFITIGLSFFQLMQQGRGRSAGGSVQFSELTAGVNRRSAAVCFLEILQLKTWGELELQQNQPYDEIEISALRTGGAAKRAAAVS